MPRKVSLNPTPDKNIEPDSIIWNTWLNSLRTRVGEGPLQIQGYARTALPSASDWGSLSSSDPFSSLIFVYNATGGSSPAYSDGSDWISFRTFASV